MNRAEIIPPGAVLPPMTPDAAAPPGAAAPGKTTSGAGTATAPLAIDSRPSREAEKRARNHTDRFKTLNAFVDTTLRELPPRQALAWLVLYRDTKPDGFAGTGFSDLATRMGCSPSTAKRVVKSLRQRRLVKLVRRGAPGRGPNVYKVSASLPSAGDEPPAPAAIQ